MKADFLQEKQVAVSLIAKRKLVGRSSVDMEEEFLNDRQSKTIMYSDQQTTTYYLYWLNHLWYTENDDVYKHHFMHYLLIDNLHRVSGIMIKERWTIQDQSAAVDSGSRAPKESFCSIGD